MKKNSIVILLVIVILGGMIFAISSTMKKAAVKKGKQVQTQEEIRKQTEVDEKLESLDVVPVIEEVKEDTSTTEKKTQEEIIDSEEVQMLSFTNARQCNKLTYLKEECRNKFVYSLAKKNNDVSYCDTLTKDIEKQDCRDEIHYNLMSCADIKNMTLKQKCEYNFKQSALITQKQETIQRASASSDVSICSSIPTYREKETCIKNVAIKTLDSSLCTKVLTDKEEQSRCSKNISYELNRTIVDQAYARKDLSLCDKITDEMVKKQCKTMSF